MTGFSVQVHPDDAYGLEHEGELENRMLVYHRSDEGDYLWS